MTLNDILKDPNYQGLPEAERRKVWHKLFDRQYGTDPSFLGLPEAEQSRARDMYAERVMGQQARQIQTAEQTGGAARTSGHLRHEDEAKAVQAVGKLKDESEQNLGVSLNPRRVKDVLGKNQRTNDQDIFSILPKDIKLNEAAATDATTEHRSQETIRLAQADIREQAKIRNKTFTLETEYQDNDKRLMELARKRGSRKTDSGEYQELMQRQAEIELNYPRIAMGMNEDQYKAFELGRRFVKEHPVLSYFDAFAVGLVNLSLGAGKMVMPGSRGFDYLTYYEQGTASEGSTLGNLVRGTISSLPMNIAMMANPTLAVPLTFADITSREVKEYYDEGTLDAQAYFASAVSGAVQTAIEYVSDTKQLNIAKDALRKHGAQAAQDAITKSVKQSFFPTMDTLRRTLHAGAMSEAAEEVFQGVASVAINHVINGKPLPDLDEFARELALSAVGGYLGGFLMGGGATGVQIYQHHEVARYLQHNAKTYESIQILQQSIDLINNAQSFNDIDTASDLLRDAKAKAVKEGVEHPRLLQGFNLASSAIMASRANQAQAIKAANKEKAAEITELKQRAEAIRREGFEPGFETEQGAKLYELEDRIKAKEREYKKGLQEIHSNKELEMMSEAIDRMDIEMAQLHAESASMPYDAEYDPTTDQGKKINAPVMSEARRRESFPEKKAAPIETKQEEIAQSEEVPNSSEPVPIDSNPVPNQSEPVPNETKEEIKPSAIDIESETKQSKSLTIGKINEDVDRADPKESKRIPEEALGGDKTVVKGRGKGSKHKIRHALIPLKDILVSHDADFNENKDYPQELQPRDRSKGASRAKNNQVTAELDPYRLMDNYLASEGRPIVVVDKDGRIIALTGNGRLIALKRRAAGEYDGIQEYEQTLREHLEEFGLNDQDTAGKVLVGVYYGDADLIQLANAMNESEGDAMSPVEQAAADAKQIANLKKHGDDIIEAIDVNTEDVMSAANAGFLRLFAERLGLDITKYQTADGKWNNDFRTRVENALFMYIFNNNESAKRALSAWREDDTSNMKSVLTGVMNAIKLIAKYRNAVEKYKTVDLDITVDLLEAIDVITRLRKEGKTLEQEANEMDLFSDGNEAIPSDKLSLYQAIAMIKTIKRGTEFIKGYYSEAMDLADPNQMSFLYDPNTSKEDFLNQYTEGYIKRNEKKKDDRSPAQRSATETPAKTHGEDREGSGRSDRSEEDVVSGRRLRTGANESRLNSIPDSVAEDALLGLFKNHIASTERDGRKLAITFKDGRKLTLDRLNKGFKITMPGGRKLDMYGRTYSNTIDGTFNVFMDLVDGLNGGNRTLYHEAFHVAWKLFMTTEQIDMISRYYAKKLGPEASIVDIEEAAATAAQNWLGNRAEVPPGFRNMFRRFWDRVRHALVTLGLANDNQKIEDIFWGLEQDRLTGKGTEDKAVKDFVAGIDDKSQRFRVDEDYRPKKTKTKLYKLCVYKDGKLYPLFVKDSKDGGGIPPFEVGKWLKAEVGDNAKTKLGKLAFRPGFHTGELPYAPWLMRKGENAGKYEWNRVWVEVEIAADKSYQKEADERPYNKGLDYLPENGYYQFDSLHKNWYISGEMKVNKILSPQEVDEINRAAGIDAPFANAKRGKRELNWDEINTSKGEGITKDGVRYRLDEAYHGTGALFNRFDVEYIGTGEGAQAFGWGIYVTENEGVARDYAKRLERPAGTSIAWRGYQYTPKKNAYSRDVVDLISDICNESPKLRKLRNHLLFNDYIPIQYLAEGIDAGLEMQDAIDNAMIRIEAGINSQASDEIKQASVEYSRFLLNSIKRKVKNREMQFNVHRGGKILYTLSVWENHQEDVLDWKGSPTEEQKAKIISALIEMRDNPSDGAWSQRGIDKLNDKIEGIKNDALKTGGELYTHLSDFLFHGNPKAASQFLLRAGIDGIKYPVNAMSGGTGNKGYNYVVFDDSQITILETTRYRAVEEKNLVTIHNIPVDSIEKVNNRGGMVMPSIAIIDATKTKYAGFGDASLIGNEQMVNVSAKQPLYTSDAYTPTYPKVYEIVKRDKNLEALAEYLSKKTKKKVSTWDLEANIEDQGSERYVASLLYGVMDYRKAQKEAVRTLEKYPINIEEKFFAGYTRNGQRRYIPHTAENALKIMKKDAKDDPSTFWGTSSLRGALAAKFSSLAQAKKNRDMILSEAEMKPIEEATDKMFEDIAARANAVRKNQRAFYHSDIASDIYDMARYGWGRIADWYKDDSIKEDFRSFISHLRSLPTQYFEYKPQRVMGINEFVAAVVPTGTKASTAKALRDAGLKVVKYEAGNDEARFEAVKKVSEEMGVRFRAEQEKSAAKPKLVKTEWRSKLEDVPHKIEGSIVARRSDWDKSLVSELSGREIVHVYWIDNGDGEVKPYGIQSAAKIMGWSKAETGRKIRQLVNEHKAEEAEIKAWRSEAREHKGAASPRAALISWEPLQAHKEQDFWAAIDRDFVFAHKDNTYRAIPKNQSEHIEAYRREGWDIQSTDQARGKKPIPTRQADTDTYSNDEQMEIRFRAEQAENTEAERQIAEVRAKYEGTDQWLKAPNGKKTNLNERQWLQVRTENFKNWFGDWENDPKNASKVVDENGEPRVVYHGSGNSFNEFMFSGYHRDIDGYYFSSDKDSAMSYTDLTSEFLYEVFLNVRNPIVKDYNGSSWNSAVAFNPSAYNVIPPHDDVDVLEEDLGYLKTIDGLVQLAISNNHDGVIANNIEDQGENLNYYAYVANTYVAFSPTQIKSATDNVGTFDPQNPDIRYRVEDTDLDARLKRAHEMLKKYKANVDPKEASEKIATEIAKAKNLDPAQADEKIGRMIRAAYREGEGKAKESLAAFGIAETEAFIQTNKPDGTDKQDLTFHMEDALAYAADMGLSEADVKNLGADRFTYYLQGLNMYGYGNALTQQLNEKYAEKQALAAKGITNEALDQEISNLISLVADARLKYENMKGAAGRLLQHSRWEKSNRIKDLIKIAEVITETRDAQIAEINAIEAEMAELNTMLTELEKEFELLLDDIERLSGSRFKSDSIEDLRERKRLMAEQRAEMKNRMEVLKHRLTKAREGLQTSEKQNRAIREQLDKAGQIEFTEEEQNVLKQIVESGVLSEEQLEAIGTTMKTGFRPTATGLKAIAPLTGSASDLTPKQAALIQKILDHGKKPPTVTEFPLMDADWIDVVSNAFYQIILSSPITHARNLIGNEANLALENIVNTVLHRDLRPVINSILSAREGVRNTKEAWKHAEAYMKKYNLDTNSRIMKKFTMITRALAAEDAFYYSRNYAAQMTGIAIAEAKRTGKSTDYILRNPTLAMIKQAEYEAARGTWNYDPEGILGYVTKAIETGVGMAQHGGKLGKISALLFKMNVMPFTRVVANVLSTALDWSPVGYLGAVKYATGLVDKEFKLGKGVTIRQRKVWTDEKGNAIKSPFARRDTTRQIARATMGTIMLSLAYMLLEGIISGSGEDDWEKRKQLMETGWRPNSIKIAGRWHSYMMLPIAPILSAIANFQERRRKPGARAEEVLAATVMGMANTILDQSFLSNLAQLMDAITGNNHRYLIRAAADTPTRVIPISPNLLRVIADAVNDKAYAPETFIQYLMYSGRPWTNGWIKDNIPARIDVFGREAKKTSSFRDFPGSPVMDGQPLYVYDKNDIPYDMRSILNTVLEAGLKIPSTNAYEARVGDDQFIKLKGFDKEQFLRQRGFYLSMGLLSYQEDIEYLAKEGEIDDLDNLLRKIASRATRDAKREMIYRYIDGEMRHKYSVYSKSKDRRKDEED